MGDRQDSGFDADVIVVGSGPSGVSAAWPMVEAGMQVMFLDGGRQRDRSLLPDGAYHDLRRHDSEQWRKFLGPELEALRPGPAPSPKLAVPASRAVIDGFAEIQRIEGRGFTVVGSLARGGLSNIWGAGLALFDAGDLADWPLAVDDLAPSYRRVAGRIGVTGFGAGDLGPLNDDIPEQKPVVLAENARRLLARYRRRQPALHALGMRIGRSPTAVLTEPLGERGECTRCDMCLWGCRRRALYNAADEIDALERHANLRYRPGAVVEAVERCEGGWALSVGGEGGGRLRTRRLVLAAGTLATTRLVLEMEQATGVAVPVLGSPAVNFALCLPERLGAAVSRREFSLAQLSLSVAGAQDRADDRVYGSLFAASGMPGAAFVDRLPLTRPGAIRLSRYVQPSLLIGNCFFSGRYSANRARLERRAGVATLVIDGAHAEDFGERVVALERILGRAFRRLGALIAPFSFSVFEPGEDLRYSGTLPMRSTPGPLQTDRHGELFGAPGLFVADGSGFPSLPARPPVLTMMALADRAGRETAERWRSG